MGGRVIDGYNMFIGLLHKNFHANATKIRATIYENFNTAQKMYVLHFYININCYQGYFLLDKRAVDVIYI